MKRIRSLGVSKGGSSIVQKEKCTLPQNGSLGGNRREYRFRLQIVSIADKEVMPASPMRLERGLGTSFAKTDG
jgi:hypothetical protein